MTFMCWYVHFGTLYIQLGFWHKGWRCFMSQAEHTIGRWGTSTCRSEDRWRRRTSRKGESPWDTAGFSGVAHISTNQPMAPHVRPKTSHHRHRRGVRVTELAIRMKVQVDALTGTKCQCGCLHKMPFVWGRKRQRCPHLCFGKCGELE